MVNPAGGVLPGTVVPFPGGKAGQVGFTREELQRTWIIRVASPGHIASLPVQCDSLEEALLAALEYFGRRNGDKSRIWG